MEGALRGSFCYDRYMASKNRVKALDIVFSQYIRLRDANDQGIISCCSCGKMVHWKESDAGHFINRRWMGVRWDERNVHAQCRHCNRFDEGNIPMYARFMEKKYGVSGMDTLLALKHSTPKYSDVEVNLMIADYRKKVKDLNPNR